jgi:hypothetical protein
MAPQVMTAIATAAVSLLVVSTCPESGRELQQLDETIVEVSAIRQLDIAHLL